MVYRDIQGGQNSGLLPKLVQVVSLNLKSQSVFNALNQSVFNALNQCLGFLDGEDKGTHGGGTHVERNHNDEPKGNKQGMI